MNAFMMHARPTMLIYINSRCHGYESECGVLVHGDGSSIDEGIVGEYLSQRSRSRASASECQMELLSYSRALREDGKTRVHTRSRCWLLNHSTELSKTVAEMRMTR